MTLSFPVLAPIFNVVCPEVAIYPGGFLGKVKALDDVGKGNFFWMPFPVSNK